jgi:hypothetical protein
MDQKEECQKKTEDFVSVAMMKTRHRRHAVYNFTISLFVGGMLTSCGALEKTSRHGFHSGYYRVKTGHGEVRREYVDVTDNAISSYPLKDGQPDVLEVKTISLESSDSLLTNPPTFVKTSLDVDITAIPLKFRPSTSGLPAQMVTDFNFALYAGWRRDNFLLSSTQDPLGRSHHAILKRGYDVGLFAGPGATQIGPYTTRQKRMEEYNGMIVQTGIAGFVETDWMSFGLAVGTDHLMNGDRKYWIYTRKPWVGFIVGVALN